MHDIARIESVKAELNRNRERAEALLARFTEPSMKQGVLSLMREVDDIEILFRLKDFDDGRSAAAEATGLDGAETALRMKVTPQLDKWEKYPNNAMLL